MSAMVVVRKRLHVCGTVQGVGFRPFVHRLASSHGLNGWVMNRSGDVVVEVEGAADAVDRFIRDVREQAPPLARVEALTVADAVPNGDASFVILPSQEDNGVSQPVPPDSATCQECLRELFDPRDRRFRYPFTNCTNCGPRFTIIHAVPYDRERTTMAGFRMCPECKREYGNPSSRRFHAQPNACPACGPRVVLRDLSGRALKVEDPIRETAARLAKGAIVAVKGIGGYHLAVDACNEDAVARLRVRKRREEKPLAIMARDLATIRLLCEVSKAEEQLLCSRERPIVLLKRLPLPRPLARSGPPVPWRHAAILATASPAACRLCQLLARRGGPRPYERQSDR